MRAVFIAGLAALAMASPAQADTWNVIGTGRRRDLQPATRTCARACAPRSPPPRPRRRTRTSSTSRAGVININNDLVIQSDITVNGASARTTIIDGNLKYRGFRITSTGNAKINHLTIRNGAAGQGGSIDGGGILNCSGSVQLNTVRVTGEPRGRRRRRDRELPGHADAGQRPGRQQHGARRRRHRQPRRRRDARPRPARRRRRRRSSRTRPGPAAPAASARAAVRPTSSCSTSRRWPTTSAASAASAVCDRLGRGRRSIGDLIARNTVAGEGLVNCGAVKPTDSGGNLEDDKDCIDAGGGLNPGLATALRNEGGELDVLPIGATSPAVDRNTASCTRHPTHAASTARRARRATPAPTSSTRPPTVTITAGPGTVEHATTSSSVPASEPGRDRTSASSPGRARRPASPRARARQPYAGLADGQLHVLGAGGGRRVHEPAGHDARVHGRGARHDDHRRAYRTRPTTTRRTFTFTGVASGSASSAGSTPRRSPAARHRTRPRRCRMARTPSRCAALSSARAHRTRRPPRRRSSSTRPTRHDDHGRPDQRADQGQHRRRSRSRPTRAARRSSARSTAARSAPARQLHRPPQGAHTFAGARHRRRRQRRRTRPPRDVGRSTRSPPPRRSSARRPTTRC